MTEAWSSDTTTPGGAAGETMNRRPSGPVPVVLLGAQETNAACALVVSVEGPGEEPPFHRHEGEDEISYVLDGSLTYYAGGEPMQAEAGMCVFIPRGVEHSFIVQTSVARVLTFYVPGGFDGFVQELGRLSVRMLNSHELERLIAVAARYGCAITGQPPK